MKTPRTVLDTSFVWMMSLALACGLIPSMGWGDTIVNPPPDVDKPFISGVSFPDGCLGTEPDNTCWLATAANMLAAAGYGSGATMQARAEGIYAEMRAHYYGPDGLQPCSRGGWPDVALNWWLNSNHNTHTNYPYKSILWEGNKNVTPWLEADAPRIMGNHLRDWEYVGLVIYGRNISNGDLVFHHAITMWGDEAALAQLTSNPTQIWVADSDCDSGGDIQHYTYDAYSQTNGWTFNYAPPTRTHLEGNALLCPVDTATDYTNTQVVVGSYKIFQLNVLRQATDLHYVVGTDVDILGYRTEIDWPRPNNPAPPTIAEDSPRRHLTVDWDLSKDPVPFWKSVTITTRFVLPSWNSIKYANVRWTYPAGLIAQLPAFRWKIVTPRLWDAEKIIPNVTGAYVIGSFDVYSDAQGSQRVGQFRGLHQYDYWQDPENHEFELAALGDVNLYVGDIRFGHSYGYLEGDSLWNFDEWLNQDLGIQEVKDGQPITLRLAWAGRLPYPEAPGPRPIMAQTPSPADWATDVPRNSILSWAPGASAQAHDVYLGTVYEDVLAANRTTPLGVLVTLGQNANTCKPSAPLALGQTYYWRVDEVEAPPSSTIIKGRVWSFTVEPFSYPITNVAATASSSDTDMGPEKTIDGSGLYEDNVHSTVATHMWLTSRAAPQPAWIQYAFDRVYKLDRMWIWNSNQLIEPLIGFGARNVTIEYSVDGSMWTTMGDFQFAQAPGRSTYTPNTTVQFSGITAKHVRLTIKRNWGGIVSQSGLSEVRFFYVPIEPRQPDPPDKAMGVDVDAVLRWRPGREAAVHRVWFSTDRQAVVDGVAPVKTVVDPVFGPGPLVFGQVYYWKVAEVNETAMPAVWEGDLWSFTTRTCAVVDDFESYTELEGSRIFDIWIDGWTNGTGSAVGHDTSPFAERTIVHGGIQSMPLKYDNSRSPYYSETERTFSSPPDWTGHGASVLSLWVQGLSANTPADLYVVVEDSGGKKATVTNPTIVTTAVWTQWKIALSSFSGVNMSKVTKLIIGVGNRTSSKAGGTGQLYIDDICVGHTF